jgi:hypothetical protein
MAIKADESSANFLFLPNSNPYSSSQLEATCSEFKLKLVSEDSRKAEL